MNSQSPIHSSALGFTVGAMITPLIAKPFLSPDASRDPFNNHSELTNRSTQDTPRVQNQTTQFDDDPSRIEIPYAIVGAALVLIGVVFLAYHMHPTPEGFEDHITTDNKSKFKAMINPATCGYGEFKYGLQLLICMFMYYLLIVGFCCPFRFFFAFFIEAPVKLSKSEATLLLTMFYACDLSSKVVCTILTRFIPVNLFVVLDVILLLFTSIVMAMFAHNVPLVLWASMAILGVLASPMWANGTAWADRYMQMNSMGVMVMMLGKSCGAFIFLPLTGQLFDLDPRNAMFVLLGCAAGLVLVTGAMNIVVRCHKEKQNHDTGEDTSDSIDH